MRYGLLGFVVVAALLGLVDGVAKTLGALFSSLIAYGDVAGFPLTAVFWMAILFGVMIFAGRTREK